MLTDLWPQSENLTMTEFPADADHDSSPTCIISYLPTLPYRLTIRELRELRENAP